MPSPAPILRVFPTPSAVAAAAAERIAELAAESIAARGRFSLALAGGSTPRATYDQLALRFAAAVDWPRVHIWWSDERCVPHDHKDSNARMAAESLLTRVGIPASNVRRVPTRLPPAAAADHYERELRAFDPTSPLDLTLLGLGTDGHTASLFPGSPALNEHSRWVVATHAPPGSSIQDRITFTLPLLATSARILFLVTGAEKCTALAQAFGHSPSAPFRVTCRSPVEWYADQAAAE